MPLRHLLRRLAWTIPTFLGITLVVFVALHAAPGDPATLRAGIEDPESGREASERAARFRAEHLLDQLLWKQYLHFLGPFDLGRDGHRWFGGSGRDPWNGVLALDFGRELSRRSTPIAGELARRLRVTVPLALAAAAITYLLAVPLGVLAAVRRGSRFDRASSFALFAIHSLPGFWAGLLLILAFGATGLGWLPVIGLADKDAAELPPLARALDVVRHAILPVATLALGGLAYLARQTRAAMIESLDQDFVRAARAKGLSERRVVLAHALPSSLLPVITLFAAVLPGLIGGSVVVETIFGIPGIGSYAYEALLARDYNVVMAVTTLSAAMTLLGILVADVLYALVDPRIRLER